MLEELDYQKVFPCHLGQTLFLLLDGHSSRFELPFLDCINDEKNKWAVCIGVPYGTAVWQVGDAEEQKGCFKIRMSEAKRKLLDKKIKHKMKPHLVPTDNMPIINYAWERSFNRVSLNQRAIAERGWFPFN